MIKVTYIDHMGSDLSVVNAARVSFGKKSDWMPRVHNGEPKVLQFKDDKLIKYLAKHKHYSPFNHTFVTFHVKAPIFVARQLVKHEYMVWNEISRRYVDEEPELYVPDVWRGRSSDKKQGSEGSVDLKQIGDYLEYGDNAFSYEYLKENGAPSHSLRSFESCLEGQLDTLISYYKSMIHYGVCPEQARMVLPQSMMTEWYWSGSLYAFAKMCSLRLKPDAQYETRLVAEQIEDKMTELFPESWTALRAYDDT